VIALHDKSLIFFSNPLKAVIRSSRYVSPYARYDGGYYPETRYDGRYGSRYDGRYDSRYDGRYDSRYDGRYDSRLDSPDDGRYPYTGYQAKPGFREVMKKICSFFQFGYIK